MILSTSRQGYEEGDIGAIFSAFQAVAGHCRDENGRLISTFAARSKHWSGITDSQRERIIDLVEAYTEANEDWRPRQAK